MGRSLGNKHADCADGEILWDLILENSTFQRNPQLIGPELVV